MSVLLWGVLPRGADAQSSIESGVFSRINAARSRPYAHHSGLYAEARAHSSDMARRQSMDHAGVDERLREVPADPPEANGNPDDGTTGYEWCENVTYVTGVPESQVAERIYRAWQGSGAHGRCMTDPAKTAGAVGVVFDGTTWWATFVAMVDRTPPGGVQQPKPAPKPTAAPKPSSPPASSPPSPSPGEAPAPTRVPRSATPPTADDLVALRLPGLSSPTAATNDVVSQPVRRVRILIEPAAAVPDALPMVSDPQRLLASSLLPAAFRVPIGWAEVGTALAALVLAVESLRRLSRRRGGSGTT